MASDETITVQKLVTFLQKYPPNTRVFLSRPSKTDLIDRMDFRRNSAALDMNGDCATTFYTPLGGETGGDANPDMLLFLVPLQ